MTQYTSFVAVEERILTDGTTPRRVEVPVEMPEGVSHQGVFGEREKREELRRGIGMGNGSGLTGGSKTMQMSSGVVVVDGASGVVNQTVAVAKAAAASPSAKPELIKEKDKVSMDDAKAATSPKLHPSIAALIQRAKQNSSASADESKFVNGNTANVQIWLKVKNLNQAG